MVQRGNKEEGDDMVRNHRWFSVEGHGIFSTWMTGWSTVAVVGFHRRALQGNPKIPARRFRNGSQWPSGSERLLYSVVKPSPCQQQTSTQHNWLSYHTLPYTGECKTHGENKTVLVKRYGNNVVRSKQLRRYGGCCSTLVLAAVCLCALVACGLFSASSSRWQGASANDGWCAEPARKARKTLCSLRRISTT